MAHRSRKKTISLITRAMALAAACQTQKEAEMYEAAERSLHAFVKSAWHIVKPGRKFIDNWHINSICQHLEAVTRGEILRLVINIPPRSTKSTVVSALWPVWTWINDSTRQFIAISNAADRSTRDSLASRRLIESEWFQKRWNDRFRLTSDQNQKTRYENNRRGHRVSYGMGAKITGEGGDFLIIDDPHDAKTAMFSEKERRNVINKFDQELSSRLNDPKRSAIVVIMQRLHEDDLAGHLLKTGEYEHLCFPMQFEQARRCRTKLGVQDPREKEGELLCAERFPKEWIDKQIKTLGIYGASGQLQQSPVPASGGIIKLKWFQRYSVLPDKKQWKRIVQFWDTAQKANELLNCPWVCGTIIEMLNGDLYLFGVFRDWMNYPTGKRIAKSLAQKHKPHGIVIEDKSSGSSLIQELKNDKDFHFSIIAFEPESDKVTRLSVESPAIESGRVYLPYSASWLPDFEQEIGRFPLSATMDQADMLSMALKYFRGKKPARIVENALSQLY